MLISQSPGMSSSSQILSIILWFISISISSKALISSTTIPEQPAAFPDFISLIAFLISSLLIFCNGPSCQSNCWQILSFIFTFKRFSIYSRHLFSTSLSSVSISPCWSLTYVSSPMSCLVRALCRATQ